MEYSVLSFNGKPSVVFVETEGGVDVHMDGVTANVLERRRKLLEARKVKKVRDAIAGGYSNYSHERGEYTGDDKKRVDAIIAKFKAKKS